MEVSFFCGMMFSTYNKPALAYAGILLTGILLWLAWPVNGFTPLVFVAFVPLLLSMEQIKSPFGFFFALFFAFVIWNAGTTWWIWNSTGPGAIGAILANSLIMCTPIMAYRFTRKRLGMGAGLISLASYWITYEFIHHNWDLSWPWLTLGNVFATKPGWIQWYQYTGTTGGTLWIWSVNLLLLFAIEKGQRNNVQRNRFAIATLVFVIFPIVVSQWLLLSSLGNTDKDRAYNIVVVQPNVEAYLEKFNTDPAVLTQSLIDLSESKIDSNTRLVVWPETAIPSQAWEHEIYDIPVFQKVFAVVDRHPQIQLVTGIDSYKLWGIENPGGFSIRQLNNGANYEAFNTAMSKEKGQPFTLYHKSKLVPGVESLPSWLGFMSGLFDDFGGIAGTLGRSEKAIAFHAAGNPYAPAPIICYESIYSDYVTEYVGDGANVLTIITNDGWWGNTQGHKQHLSYARLRAIETGLWVARSANTGISCFIDPQGEIYDAQDWDTQAAIKKSIPTESHPSFYARTGDWISRGVLVLAALLFIWSLINRNLWKKQ